MDSFSIKLAGVLVSIVPLRRFSAFPKGSSSNREYLDLAHLLTDVGNGLRLDLHKVPGRHSREPLGRSPSMENTQLSAHGSSTAHTWRPCALSLSNELGLEGHHPLDV